MGRCNCHRRGIVVYAGQTDRTTKPGRPPGRPPGRGPIDWDTIRLLYVQGEPGPDGLTVFPSYADLANRFSVGVGSVASEGAEHGWPEARRTFQQGLSCEIERKVLSQAGEPAALLAAEAVDLARGYVKILGRLAGPLPLPGDTRYDGPSLEKFERAEKLARVLRVLMGALPSGAVSSGPGRTEEDPPLNGSGLTLAESEAFKAGMDAYFAANQAPATHGAEQDGAALAAGIRAMASRNQAPATNGASDDRPSVPGDK